MRPTVSLDFEAEFASAWADPRHTRFELPDMDVNQVLDERYRTGRPLVFTREMLWDVEVRKAADPGVYIPFVVQAGSGRAWGRHWAPGGGEHLVRSSRQRLWLRPDEYATILERAYLNHLEQRVTFLGALELEDTDGSVVHADTAQPLFHVEHSVGGAESRPLNRWRIVHLTERVDDRILARFSEMAGQPWLPEFIEIYIRRDLGMELARREP
jgi:hypothetical protein